MSVAEFHTEFYQDVLVAADGAGTYVADAFFDLFTQHLVDAGELDTADRAYHEARGIRVDGYGGDPLDSGTLTLIVMEADLTPDIGTLTRTDMDASFRRARTFIQQSLRPEFRSAMDPSDPGFGLADLVARRWNFVQKVRLLLLTDRKLSSRIDGKDADEIGGIPVVHSVWDIGALADLVILGRGSGVVELDLAETGGTLAALPAHSVGEDLQAYMLVIPGEQLALIYDKWGPRLLEQNVRVFLQARGNVNKGIRNTLANEPAMFLSYNNGISATAESVTTRATARGLEITHLTNLQIVNGGQTTASVHAAMRAKVDLSRVFVQMKLSVIRPEITVDVVPKISQYANTQNRVNAADFFANHPYHVRIQDMSRRLFAPSPDGAFKKTKWFYERARGQYQDDRGKLTPAARRAFDAEYPKRQLFTKTDLAKFQMTWLGSPHIVSRGAQKNFVAFAEHVGKEWVRNEKAINELYFREAIAAAILFRETERLVPQQSWYEGGYRANIVTYTLAKLSHDLKRSGRVLDMNAVWNRQGIDEPTMRALEACAEVVNEILVNPPPTHRNVTEWAKQQACWDRVSQADVPWPPGLMGVTASAAKHRQQQHDAAVVRKIDDGIEIQSAVVTAGAAFWRRALDWGVAQRGLLTAKEVGILQTCAKMPRVIPTEAQARVAHQTITKLQQEGYQEELP